MAKAKGKEIEPVKEPRRPPGLAVDHRRHSRPLLTLGKWYEEHEIAENAILHRTLPPPPIPVGSDWMPASEIAGFLIQPLSQEQWDYLEAHSVPVHEPGDELFGPPPPQLNRSQRRNKRNRH